MKKDFYYGDILKTSWKLIEENYALFFVATIFIYFIPRLLTSIYVFSSASQFLSPDKSLFQILGTVSVLHLVTGIITLIATCGLIKVSLDLHEGKKPVFSELLQSPSVLWKYIVTTVVNGIIVAFGFILFIIPGIIFSLKYCLAPYISIDKKISGMEALRQSDKYTMGAKAELLMFGLILLVIEILLSFGNGMLIKLVTHLNVPKFATAIIGLIVSTPITTVAISLAVVSHIAIYKKLQAQTEALPPSPEVVPTHIIQ